MRRRSLLIGAGLAVPAALLAKVEKALAVLPAPKAAASASEVASLLGQARLRFDTGDLTAFLRGLPDLLSAGHDVLDRAPSDERHLALLAGCYDLASEALQKVGRLQASRITADRAATYATLSGDPVAQAMAARSCGIVLRHQGHRELAEQVTYAAATRLDNSGLRTAAAANTLAQILCTSAYNAAQAGDRDRAIELIAEAARAARTVPHELPAANRFAVTPAQVALYRVGVHWALGEPGAAMRAGQGLHPAQFPTPERRARLLTDLARVWAQADSPSRAIGALLAAHGHARAEVRDRAGIRGLAIELVRRHPTSTGADRLALVLAGT